MIDLGLFTYSHYLRTYYIIKPQEMKDEQNVTAIKEVKREGMIKSCPKKE